jgi:hypothetical protein
MAARKYDKYLMPAEVKTFREGENPSLEFIAAPLGVDVTWVIMSTTKVMDEEIRRKLRENPHTHTFSQFITSWGSNPYNIGEYNAESWVALGEELEDQIIDKPSVYVLPPGLKHGSGSKPGKVDKPGYHMDLSFAAQYQRTDYADPGERKGSVNSKSIKSGENKYGKYIVPAEIKTFREGENPSLLFNAAPYGVNAQWAIMSITKVLDDETRKKLREIPHTHTHHQFITFFGNNPYNLGEFDAEIPILLGEELEEYVIDKPTVLYLPPGLIHGMSLNPGRVGKPIYHVDFSLAAEYQRTDLPA